MMRIRSGLLLLLLGLTVGAPSAASDLPDGRNVRSFPAWTAPLPPSDPSAPTGQDVYWGSEFALPTPNGNVLCAAEFGGGLVVGGEFTVIGGKSISYLARWNGSDWFPLGSGVDGPVRALLLDGNRLLVGGDFRHAGGLPVDGLALWDNDWSMLTTGPAGHGEFHSIRAMTFYQGDFIVAGVFESASDHGIRNIARYGNESWEALGSGLDGTIQALAIYDNSLYATGSFSGPVAILARWNGTTWSGFAEFSGGFGTALTVFQDRLWVGGSFVRAIGQPDVGLAAWDGAAWTYPLGYQNVSALEVHQDRLVIGYWFGLNIWDGESYVDSPFFYGAPYALLSMGTGLFIGGPFSAYGNPPFQLGRWDGTTFHPYEVWTPSMNGLASSFGGPAWVSALTSYRDQLLVKQAGDGIQLFPGSASGWVENLSIPAWTGSTWKSFEPAPPYNGLPSITLSSSDRLFMAGYFTDPGLPSSYHSVIEYDGTQWTSLDTLPGSPYAMGIAGGNPHTALAPTPDQGFLIQHMYSWDGTHWIPIGVVRGRDSSGEGPVEGITEFRGELIVHGEFTAVGEVFAPGIAAWNGQSWHPLGPGAPGCYLGWGEVQAVTYQDRLVVPTYPCDPYNDEGSLQEWDGETWTALPGLRGTVMSLATIRGLLYVGGELTIDEVPGHYMAMWDGHQWTGLGSGLNGPANSIVEHQGSIYFGGPFTTAGGRASFGLARWSRTIPVPPTRAPSIAMAGPNPFRVSADLSFWMGRAGSARVGVYDIQGRQIALLADGHRGEGLHQVRWNGKDDEGNGVPAGVYFVRVKTEEGESSRKIIHLK